MQQVVNMECEVLRKDLKAIFSTLSNLSLTMDIWSDAKMRGFLGVTAHYISNGALKTSVLEVVRFKGILS